MSGYWVRDVRVDDVLRVAAAVIDAHRVGGEPERAGRFLLADRAEHLLAGLAHPEMSPTPHAPHAAAALAWMVADCAGDEHAAMWLAHQLANLGLSNADVVRQADPGDRYLRGVASFGSAKSDYALVPLADLPAPHSPFRCGHIDRFNAELSRQRRWARLRPLVGQPVWTEGQIRLRAGSRFRDANPCGEPCERWHRTPGLDWAKVAQLAAEVLNAALPEAWGEAEVVRLVRASAPADLADLVASQFRDPVTWSPGDSQVSNGQHRILAFHAAGVPAVLVRIH